MTQQTVAKHVSFEWDEGCLWWTARFYKGDVKIDFKRLTEVEEENLAEVLTSRTFEFVIPMERLIEMRDSGDWQDSEDGDTTNFELMLNDLEKN